MTAIHATVRDIPLTKPDLDHYHAEGYVLLGRVVDDTMLDALRAEEARFRGNSNELTIFRSQLAHHSVPIRSFTTAGPPVALARQLVGTDNLMLWFNQFVTKLPDARSGRSEFPWHQDNGYVAIDPATNVTIWVALDDVDERNGCVWVMPRSHHRGLLKHGAKSPDAWHLTVPVDGDGVPAVLRAGEAIAFSGLTLHRSKLNHTDRPRRALFMEYADAAAKYHRSGDQPHPVTHAPNVYMVTGAAPWSQA